MSSFLYLIPNSKMSASVEDIDDSIMPLKRVLKGSNYSRCEITGGPDGRDGWILAPAPAYESGGDEALCGYHPDNQQWAVVKDKDGDALYYIGYYTGQPPQPQDVIRETAVAGTNVMLGDGASWRIPVVKGPFTTLRSTFTVDESGAPKLAISNGYQIPESDKFFDIYANGGTVKYIEDHFFEYAVSVLGINYRVGLYECGMLGLIDTENIWKITRESFGNSMWGEELELRKKGGAQVGT